MEDNHSIQNQVMSPSGNLVEHIDRQSIVDPSTGPVLVVVSPDVDRRLFIWSPDYTYSIFLSSFFAMIVKQLRF